MPEVLRSPGFVRYVRDAVRHVVRYETRAVIGLCGMCGMTRTRAHEQQRTTTPQKRAARPHAHVNACRTTRTTRTTRITTRLSSVRHAFLHTAQPAQKKIEEVLTMEKPIQPMACGPENVIAFRQAFREAMGDEGQAFLRALFDAGMVEGLRGVRIGPLGGLNRPGEASVCPALSDAAQGRLADLAWKRAQGGQ